LKEFNLDWEPNERDAWVVDAQRWIGQITGVLQCKIDLDAAGEVTGIHVVAGMDREPRHIVRDVESLLKARLDLDVYYKKIGVVQVLEAAPADAEPSFTTEIVPPSEMPPLSVAGPEPQHPLPPASVEEIDPIDDEEPTGPVPVKEAAQTAVILTEEIAPRLVCNGVGTMASDQAVRAEVILQAGDVEARGTSDGPNSFGSDLTLVARATLEAVSQLVDEPITLHLNEIRQEQVGGRQVVLTAVELVEGRRTETLFGTCACEHNRQQAVVYSILDALNRRLTMFALKVSAPARSAEATA
jgi:hypothetical protein